MSESPLAEPNAVSRQSLRWSFAALAPFAIAEASRRTELPAVRERDYAQYRRSGRGLVEGRPYSDIGYIYSPRHVMGPWVHWPGVAVGRRSFGEPLRTDERWTAAGGPAMALRNNRETIASGTSSYHEADPWVSSGRGLSPSPAPS